MDSKPSPIFPVSAPSTKSAEENVRAIEAHAHVVEVKAPYALVHASPVGVAKIAELGLEVFHSKRGGEYYAVRIAKGANLGLVPPAPVSAPVQRVQPQVGSAPSGAVRMVLKGADYIARETRVKRTNIDVRRFEVRKDGELVQEPYVVSFQSEDGHTAQCSCPDWIYLGGDWHVWEARELAQGRWECFVATSEVHELALHGLERSDRLNDGHGRTRAPTGTAPAAS
jgi:hypothetical protein